MKLNATGNALAYSTYLGGSNSENTGSFLDGSLAVDGFGNAYVTGTTDSTDFPTTPGAFDQTGGVNNDAFVTKLNALGSALLYSTYLGGDDNNDQADGIAVDSAGSAYVAGWTFSSDFPTATIALNSTVSDPGADDTATGFNHAWNVTRGVPSLRPARGREPQLHTRSRRRLSGMIAESQQIWRLR